MINIFAPMVTLVEFYVQQITLAKILWYFPYLWALILYFSWLIITQINLTHKKILMFVQIHINLARPTNQPQKKYFWSIDLDFILLI